MTCPPIRLRVSPRWILLVAAASAAGCQQKTSDAGGAAGSGPPTTNVTTGSGGGAAPDASGPTQAADAAMADATPPGEDVAAPREADAAPEVPEPPVVREYDAAPPSADALATTESTQKVLEGLAAQVEGARVVFVDCTATPCTARVSAPTLTALRTLLVEISDAFHGRTSFVARERFGGFTGHVFEADLVLDTDKPRPVPASEDELLNDLGT